MSTKASTAALDRFSQRLLLPGVAFRATRLAVKLLDRKSRRQIDLAKGVRSGVESQGGFSEEKPVSFGSSKQKEIEIACSRLNLGRRILTSTVLGALTILVPAIASAGPTPQWEVRVSRTDGRVIESGQRWANGEDESWCEEA